MFSLFFLFIVKLKKIK